MRRLLFALAIVLTPALVAAQSSVVPGPYINGSGIPVGPIVAATGCTAPPYAFSGSLTSGLCSAATNTASLEAGGTEVARASSTAFDLGALQLSLGSAIGSTDLLLKRIAAGQFGIQRDSTHGITADVTNDAQFRVFGRDGTTAGSVLAGTMQLVESASAGLAFASSLGGSNHTKVASTAEALFRVTNSANAGVLINAGTAAPTVTSCGTGSVTSTSNNTAGEITATGATTCTVTFGAPNWTNTPFCTVTDETTAAALRISAISATAFTVTNLTSGDKFMFHCLGGV